MLDFESLGNFIVSIFIANSLRASSETLPVIHGAKELTMINRI